MNLNILGDLLSSMIIFAVPLLLVALGGMCSERSGIINIALDGIMIIGALIGCIMLKTFDASFGKDLPILASLIAIIIAGIAGAVFSLLLAFASIHLKANQTIGGTALNIMAPAVAVIVAWALQGQGNTTIRIPTWVSLHRISADPSLLERIFLKNCFVTTFVAVILFIVVYVLLYKTKFGLRLRSCGEHPQASASVGIHVFKMRYIGVIMSGFLAGIGGLAFVVAAGTSFTGDVAGYGFLALAVMIFGNWKPIRILIASLVFAFFSAVSGMTSSITFLPQFANVQYSFYIYYMVPYIVTMIILAFTSKRSRAPKAEGIPYDKGQR